ncbi:MAG: hypothetical protein AABX11_04190 [Nanoarchaeota archaeon]
MEPIVKKETNWHDKYFKLLLIIPVALLLFTLVYLYIFKTSNDDFFLKDVSLTGGTTVSVFDANIDAEQIVSSLKTEFPDLQYRIISDFGSGKQHGFSIETASNSTAVIPALEKILGYKLTEDNSSVEFSGASLSAGFYSQLRIAMLVAFLGMSLVVFFIFRTFVPSFAIIVCALADILMTIMAIDLLGMRLSSAGIVALLMLIGYSVDTDILLTSRLLKTKEGSLNSRLFGAFKTGMTMTLTAIASVTVALIVIFNLSETLKQMFTIILIGLVFDIMNTWITNGSILKWYMEVKKIE